MNFKLSSDASGAYVPAGIDANSKRLNPLSGFGSALSQKSMLVDGVKVNYFEAGSGDRCILLIHGGLNSTALSTWSLRNGFLEDMSHDFRVIAPDLPGYGESEKPDKCSQSYYVEFIKDFLSGLGVKKATLAGTSLGGGIALGFAIENPVLVDALILIGPYGISESTIPKPLQIAARFPKISGSAIKFLYRHNKAVGWALSKLVRDKEKEDAIKNGIKVMNKEGVQKAFYEFMADEAKVSITSMVKRKGKKLKTDYRDEIKKLDGTGIRLLIINGDKDPFVTIDDASKAISKVAGAKLEIMKGCTHAPHYQNPEEFKSIVRNFV